MPYPVFDLHSDTADRLAWQTLPQAIKDRVGMDAYGPGDADHLSDICDLACNRGHLSLDAIGATPWVQCLACYIPDDLSPAEATTFHAHVEAYLLAQAERHDAFTLAQSVNDIPEEPAAGQLVGIKTIENARLFAADLSLIERLAQQGLLMASLSWNAPGPLASGHDDEMAGLTSIGIEALRRMEDAHVLLDVSHLNDRSFDDVLRHARHPFVASHSNSRAVCGHPRNLTDAQFAEIRDRGGIVGLNYCCLFLSDSGEPTFDDISRHIDHWLELGGENTIALGSDFDGCDTPACIATAREMPSFQEQLVRRFGDDITRALCYDNALAFFRRAAA